MLEPIRFIRKTIIFIDQTKLPARLQYVKCRDVNRLCTAIRRLEIRGAPLIGVAVALGYALAAVRSKAKAHQALQRDLEEASKKLRNTRPTAVNLFWALDRMEKVFLCHCEHIRFAQCKLREAISKKDCFTSSGFAMTKVKKAVLKEALNILKEDRTMCRQIGINGAKLIKNGDVLLTHCNAGMLATAGYGTALSILYEAQRQHKKFKVFADETRPLLQGARLTMWELMKHGIDATLICDNMAATTIKNKGVTKIIVGADRIARNGDAANKIGTYGLAVLARHHRIPFYVAAPSSTIDRDIPSGKYIPIEERKKEELIYIGSKQTAPKNAQVFNPAFDVTPHALITAIITEKGIHEVKKSGRI